MDVQADIHILFKTIEIKGKLFSDQTGKFPINFSRANKYIMVIYAHDINDILAEPITNKSQQEIIRAMTKMHKLFTDRRFKPKMQMLDNKCPESLKFFFRNSNVGFQLVPPRLHQTISAERAISTFKDHFIVGISGVDPSFLMHV